MADKVPNSQNTAAILGAAGAILMVLTLALDFFGLGTRRGIGTGQQILLAAGLILLGVGFASRWEKPRRWLSAGGRMLGTSYQMAAFSVFNLVLLILGVELAGTLIDRLIPDPPIETRGAYYTSQPWARQHWQEFERIKKHYVYSPYTIWQTRPFVGGTLLVDERGKRRTLEAAPTEIKSDETFLVFAFGGSAMWGHGAPDHATIPAYLQTGLTRALKRQVRVENFGERGHVATQSLIRLLLELQAERIPDRVIFHHGFNDVATSLAGRPGSHFAESRLAELLQNPFLASLSRSRVLKTLRPVAPGDFRLQDQDANQRRAVAIVDNYLGSFRLLSALAREYGFDFYCFWQPVRRLRRPALDDTGLHSTAEVLELLLETTYREIERRSSDVDRLDSLADVLDRDDDMVWADPVHLTPRGNRIVAAAMLKRMRRDLNRTDINTTP